MRVLRVRHLLSARRQRPAPDERARSVCGRRFLFSTPGLTFPVARPPAESNPASLHPLRGSYFPPPLFLPPRGSVPRPDRRRRTYIPLYPFASLPRIPHLASHIPPRIQYIRTYAH